MKITIEATETLTEIDGVPVRLWQGVTDSGIFCKVFVHRIAVHKDANTAELDAELKSVDAPRGGPNYVPLPLALVL